jgi:hypothetical protein
MRLLLGVLSMAGALPVDPLGPQLTTPALTRPACGPRFAGTLGSRRYGAAGRANSSSGLGSAVEVDGGADWCSDVALARALQGYPLASATAVVGVVEVYPRAVDALTVRRRERSGGVR